MYLVEATTLLWTVQIMRCMIRCFLNVQGLLLPDLVEFYQWLHTALAHTVTYERATTLPIGRVINLAAMRYPREMGDHLVALYERLKG